MCETDGHALRPEPILVVDDDRAVREMLLTLLREAGFEGRGAGNVTEALALLEREPFALVVTDFHLNDDAGSGLDLIDEVARRDETLPVILITAHPSIRLAVDGIRRGAVDFLPKPFSNDQFLHMVRRGLDEHRLRRERLRLQSEVHKLAVIEQLNRQLDARVQELTRLQTVAQRFDEFLDSDALLGRIVETAQEVTGARRVSLMLLDRGRRALRIRRAVGVPPDVVRAARQPLGRGVAGRVALEGRPQRVALPAPPVGERNGRRYETASWLSMPLVLGSDTLGVLNLTDKLDGSAFTDADERVVRHLLDKASMRLENQALYESIYENLVSTLHALVTTIEAKDPYTCEHSRRVTDYAVLIAQAMGLDETAAHMLAFAGMLHDIGKIGVRDEILIKSGPLTDDERAQIQRHPLIGERIVEPLGLVREERAIIRSHHERWDGRGYPDGLAGEAIPPLARILAVADAFDAMTTTRAYRKARPLDAALDEMRRCSGTQFDPAPVEALLELIEDGALVPPADPSPAPAILASGNGADSVTGSPSGGEP